MYVVNQQSLKCLSHEVMSKTHTWYLSQVSQVRYVEKKLSCGEISNLYAWQMWRNLKFLNMWSNFKFLHIVEMWRNLTFLHMLSNFKFLHMTDVEKFEVSPHLACVWCGECLNICTRYAVLFKNWFCRDIRRFVAKSFLSRFTHFCVEKNWTKDYVCGQKVTNIRYALRLRRRYY